MSSSPRYLRKLPTFGAGLIIGTMPAIGVERGGAPMVDEGALRTAGEQEFGNSDPEIGNRTRGAGTVPRQKSLLF
jgi:hypothetical protein